MDAQVEELRFHLSNVIKVVAGLDEELGKLSAEFAALRLTLAEFGPEFENVYAKHHEGQTVQQLIQVSIASRDVLLGIAQKLENRIDE